MNDGGEGENDWAEDIERVQRDRQIRLAISGIGLIASVLWLFPELAGARGKAQISAESFEFAIPFVVCVVLAQLVVFARRRAYATAKATKLPRAIARR